MKDFFLTITLLFTLNYSFGQWKKIGFNGLEVRALEVKNDSLIAGEKTLKYTVDNGNSWRPLIEKDFISDFLAIEVYKNYIWAASGDDKIQFSENGGSTWIELSLPPKTADYDFLCASSLMFLNNNLYIAATCNGVLKWNLANRKWLVNNDGLSTKNMRSLTHSKGKILAGGAFGALGIRDTSEGRWTSTHVGKNGGYILDMDAAGDTIFAAAHFSGMMVSKDGGTTWSGNEINSTPWFSSVFFYKNILFAGSREGIFFSNNLGENWTPFTTGLSDSTVYEIKAIRDTLFVGTADGVWARPFQEIEVLLYSEIDFAAQSISFYPNPASTNLSVSLTDDRKAWLDISDLNGRRVIQTKVSNQETISIEAIPPGIYLLKIRTEANTVYSKLEIRR
ncbi:MAG TPA: T9SS type A sorting domain-containing protein [Cytophagaceae bacterium]|jgi:hypothetical protein